MTIDLSDTDELRRKALEYRAQTRHERDRARRDELESNADVYEWLATWPSEDRADKLYEVANAA